MSEQDMDITYKVVMNEAKQYPIWPANRENASGWNDAGFKGSKQDCLEYIKKVWIPQKAKPLTPEEIEAQLRMDRPQFPTRR